MTDYIKSKPEPSQKSQNSRWLALSLCAAVVIAGVFDLLVNSSNKAQALAPNWIAFVAAALAAFGVIQLNNGSGWFRIQRAMLWSGLLLMVWTANGLPFDLLRMGGWVPGGVYWPGFVTRALAIAAVVVLARMGLSRPDDYANSHPATWYGYAAFILALPYPVLWTYWALGGTLGPTGSSSVVHGIFSPFVVPWLLAAILSLFLVSTPRWMPRRLLLVGGWTATAIVAMIGPAACWTLVAKLMEGGDLGLKDIGIANWVPFLFYGSWLLFAIAEGAATREYQLRSGS